MRCGRKVTAALFPKVDSPEKFASMPEYYQAGFAIAMVVEGVEKLNRCLQGVSPLPAPREPTEEEILRGFKYLFGEDGEGMFETFFKDEGREFCEWAEAFEAQMDTRQRADFAQGMADAFRMLAGENKSNDATEIYLFMSLFWRVVEQLRSVDQLHQVLIKILGRNRAGYDPKRVAQICHRVGKRFRRRGRPRKIP